MTQLPPHAWVDGLPLRTDEADLPGSWAGRRIVYEALPFRFVAAWPAPDATLRAEAADFWSRLDLLDPAVDKDARAHQLAAAIYADDHLVGVATAELLRLDEFKARFAFVRTAVDPAQRGRAGARALASFARREIEAWAQAHPDENVLGMAAIFRDPSMSGWHRPVTRSSNLALVGYLDGGEQLRIAWFEHARLP